MILKDKKILVAGAAGLLGTELVKELIQQGAKVVAADINIERLQERFSEGYSNVNRSNLELKQIDLSNKDLVVSLFDSIDGLTGAVNCSYPRNKNYGKHFYNVAIEDFNENISLNLGSSFLFMQQCADHFNKNKTPFSLVNISSVYGVIAPKFEIYEHTPMTMPVEYAAIKSGLIHLSKYVTKYVANSNFRVNVVSPGGIFDNQPSNFLKAYKDETFGKGMLDVKDVLGTIVFLLSSMSDLVNGQNIVVDDGFSV